jgi:hypothetical protein
MDAGDALERAQRGGDLLRDDARRLAQPARELERERHREIAERPPRRRFHGNGRDHRIVSGDAIQTCHRVSHP